ncbi:hypothetical protein G9A89_010617 [Geosiphon pyriformis]|nr:hypothetical protein G9A89_010617 [Geosiphon pyriformis]
MVENIKSKHKIFIRRSHNYQNYSVLHTIIFIYFLGVFSQTSAYIITRKDDVFLKSNLIDKDLQVPDNSIFQENDGYAEEMLHESPLEMQKTKDDLNYDLLSDSDYIISQPNFGIIPKLPISNIKPNLISQPYFTIAENDVKKTKCEFNIRLNAKQIRLIKAQNKPIRLFGKEFNQYAQLANGPYCAPDPKFDFSSKIKGKGFTQNSKLIIALKGDEENLDQYLKPENILVPYGPGIFSNNGIVHQKLLNNFLVAKDAFMAKIGSLIQLDDPQFELVFVGHSLGGVYSILGALELLMSNLFPNSITIYTFGIPPFGDESFAKFASSNLAIYRITNVIDDVPQISHPFELLPNLKHAGQEVWIKNDKLPAVYCLKKNGEKWPYGHESDIFHVIMCHIYEQEILLDELNDVKKIMEIILAADELMLPDFAKFCQNFLITGYKKWVNRNLVQVLNTAFEHPLIFDELTRRIIHKMSRGSVSLLKTAHLHKLEKKTLIAVLERGGVLNPGSAWELCLRWSFSQVLIFEKEKYELDIKTLSCFSSTSIDLATSTLLLDSLREKISILLKFVPFSQMSHNDFIEKVVPHRQLFSKESIESIESLKYYLAISDDLEELEIPATLTLDPLLPSSNLPKNFKSIMENSSLINHLHTDIIIGWITFYRQDQYSKFNSKGNETTGMKPRSRLSTSSLFKRLYQNIQDKTMNREKRKQQKRLSEYSFIMSKYKFSLIYRHTRDKYTFKDYRLWCHNTGPIVVITRIRDSRTLIGGYCDSLKNQDPNTISEGLSFTFEDSENLEKAGKYFLNCGTYSFDGSCFGIDDLILDFTSSRGSFKQEPDTEGDDFSRDQKKFTFDECEIFQIIHEE